MYSIFLGKLKFYTYVINSKETLSVCPSVCYAFKTIKQLHQFQCQVWKYFDIGYSLYREQTYTWAEPGAIVSYVVYIN